MFWNSSRPKENKIRVWFLKSTLCFRQLLRIRQLNLETKSQVALRKCNSTRSQEAALTLKTKTNKAQHQMKTWKKSWRQVRTFMRVSVLGTANSKTRDQAPEVRYLCFRLGFIWRASSFASSMIQPWNIIRLHLRALLVLAVKLPLCKDKLLMLKGYSVSMNVKKSCCMLTTCSYNTTNLMTKISKTGTQIKLMPLLAIWGWYMFKNLSQNRNEILCYSNPAW